MAIKIRDKIIQNATPFLEPGEQIQAVMGAQTFSQYWSLLSYWIVLFKNAYRCIVVTDRRIAVFNTGKMAMGNPKELLRNVARGTQIGPAHGLWYKTENLGEKLYIHKRFHKDIEVADSMLAGHPSQPLPPPTA